MGHFHLIFTLPAALHPFVRSHQRILHSVLMKATAHALMTLARDPKFLGGRISILAVLHTWGGAMTHHPHVHFLVPAGGLSPDGSRWIPSRKKFLVHVQALSILFRARFMALARKALPQVRFPESIWKNRWVVHCKPAVRGTERVLEYLGRYVHRIAITNRRILSVDDRTVSFRYKDSRDGRWKTMTLATPEFLRRFLQHVLPRGFHQILFRRWHMNTYCDLHLHLGGSISKGLVRRFAKSDHDKHAFEALEESDVLTLFQVVHRLVQSPERVEIATEDVITTSTADYLEIRSTPREITSEGSFRPYVEAFVAALHRHPGKAKGILSIDRYKHDHANARNIITLALEYPDCIVGIDISGVNPLGVRTLQGEDLTACINIILDSPLGLAIHVGELESLRIR